MQAWLVKGGQSKYTGHCCSFINDINKIVQKVPLYRKTWMPQLFVLKTLQMIPISPYLHQTLLSMSNANDSLIIFEFQLSFTLGFKLPAESFGIQLIPFQKMTLSFIDYEISNKQKLRTPPTILAPTI